LVQVVSDLTSFIDYLYSVICSVSSTAAEQLSKTNFQVRESLKLQQSLKTFLMDSRVGSQ